MHSFNHSQRRYYRMPALFLSTKMKEILNMDEAEYRTHPAICNSDLSNLTGYLFPHSKPQISAVSARFGHLFHQLILEPEKVLESELISVGEKQVSALQKMKESFFYYEGVPLTLVGSKKEVSRFWTCEITGLLLKARLDIVKKTALSSYILDLKSTSCRSVEAFRKSILEYGYDRQGAFYLDSDPDASKFIIIGVQKAAPFSVFIEVFDRSSETIIEGRKKIQRLLKTAAYELQQKGGWRPRRN